jgi:hypothetical protein
MTAMTAPVTAVPLPVFDDEEKIGAALDSPGVVASGALVSKEGDRYWVHSVDELTALRSQRRANETLRDVRSHGRELRRVDLGEEKAVRFRLVKPKPDEAYAALRDVFADIGLNGPTRRSFSESAFVFSYAGAAYVLVGTSYHCSEDVDEHFNQTQYDKYNGECPFHTGGKLVLDTDD